MLTTIRMIIYKAGLRPKYGSVFFSPTLDINYAFDGVIKSFDQGYKEGAAQLKRMELYLIMKYCVICGEELVAMDAVKLEIKECPQGCGSACADIDADGAPFIAFDR